MRGFPSRVGSFSTSPRSFALNLRNNEVLAIVQQGKIEKVFYFFNEMPGGELGRPKTDQRAPGNTLKKLEGTGESFLKSKAILKEPEMTVQKV